MFRNVSELVSLAESRGQKISDLMIDQEVETTGISREVVLAKMEESLKVMERAVDRGLTGVRSLSGLSGGDAVLLAAYRQSGRALTSSVFLDAITYAVATNEVNAAMGIICATPTAGSAGVVPAVLLALREKLALSREAQIGFLFTAGAFGGIIANNAVISGAAGGCQAEIGSASAMAAAAAVEAAGGTPAQSAHALAIALKNMLGLSCDPVAGLVEIPCIKRNAAGASNALCAAEMALAGIESKIPCDQVIDAMLKIGQAMPVALRETAQGGLAATPEGRALRRKILVK